VTIIVTVSIDIVQYHCSGVSFAGIHIDYSSNTVVAGWGATLFQLLFFSFSFS